jgi:lipoyl(octanoyl) transferase
MSLTFNHARSPMKPRGCQVLDLGLRPYAEVYSLQKELVRSKAENSDADTLILVEHLPVITLGRRGRHENIRVSVEYLKSLGIDVVSTDRGGDVTYHGPGQLVGYPILDLKAHKQDVNWILRTIEQALIASLQRIGINAQAEPGFTGVWVDGAKIAAIGIGISHWITFHGFALNVAPMMEHFNLIIPCGIRNKPVTCVRDLLARTLDMDEVKRIVSENFCEAFGLEQIPA